MPLLLVHPEGPRDVESSALFSAADLVPTLLGLAGLDTKAYLEQLPLLAGHDQSVLATNPQAPGAPDESGNIAYWTGLTFLDPANVRRFDEVRKRPHGLRQVAKLQMIRKAVGTIRGAMRGVITQRHKLARYFAPVNHHQPQTWEQLVAHDDIELYDLQDDPQEQRNLAERPEHRDTVLQMNARLNALIAREICADLGRFLPWYMRA